MNIKRVAIAGAVMVAAAWLAPARGAEEGKPLVELKGTASDFHFTRNWAGGRYWREDFTFLLTDEKSGKVWRVISREPTPWNELRCGTTYTGLDVDWAGGPTVKVIGVVGVDRYKEEFYDLKLNPAETVTALIVRIAADSGSRDWYVNNWFHGWGGETDVKILEYYADKDKPYDVYGWLGGTVAPFSTKSQAIVDATSGKRVFHGFVRKTDRNELGYEIELIHLLGRNPDGGHVLFGDPETLTKLDSRKAEGASNAAPPAYRFEEIGQIDLPYGRPCEVAVTGGRAYMANGAGGLMIAELGDSGNPRLLGRLITGNSGHAVARTINPEGLK